ncbi:MAG: hypothetical protein JXX28_10680 [Deltaproteobacteria bacterium]|nr:hypothetical protein [Deltaproteobacteria bacterium]
MITRSEGFSQAIEDAVAQVEERTDAEVVVVLAERSGSYRDLAMVAATALSLALLVALFFAPWTFHPVGISLEIAAFWAIATWALDRTSLPRLLAGARRQRAQVRAAARAEFVAELVHATPHRTGVLVYVSALEREVLLLPDLGVEGRVPAGLWADLVPRFHHADLPAFQSALAAMGGVLAAHIPKLEVDEVDLPNAPRVRK